MQEEEAATRAYVKEVETEALVETFGEDGGGGGAHATMLIYMCLLIYLYIHMKERKRRKPSGVSWRVVSVEKGKASVCRWNIGTVVGLAGRDRSREELTFDSFRVEWIDPNPLSYPSLLAKRSWRS